MTLLLSSIAPALLIMYLIYRHDLEKEPLKMVVIAFFAGVVSIFVSLLFSLPLSAFENALPSGFLAEFYRAFFTAAIPEELAKWLVFWVIIQRARDFDQYYDGILYAIFISMGFALVENIIYVMKGGISVAILRAILAVPGHMLFAVAMGYFLSLSKFEQGTLSIRYRAYSLMIPIVLHGTYDFILMYMEAKSKTFPLMVLPLLVAFVAFDIYMWRLGLRKLKAMRNRDSNTVN